jgi:hypothetical protein
MSRKRHKPEAIVAKLAPGGCPGCAGHPGGGCDPLRRGDRGGLRDELLDGEIFYSLREAKS